MRHRSRGIFTFASLLALLTLPTRLLRAEPPADAHRNVLVRTAPVYPELAKRMRLGGEVSLHVSILPDGTVSEVRIESGHALLRQAAQDAVRHWRFVPAPSPSECNVTVTFQSP